MQTHISVTWREDIAYITLACDEPGKPPTLDHPALDELIACTQEIAAGGEQTRAVIVQSDSAKYFCVGANINVLKTLDADTIVPWIEHGHAALNALEALPLPVIARVDGYALGGGLELAMACDIIVASHSARLGQTEALLGVVAGWGGSFRLPRRIGATRAKEMFFSGRMIGAEEAERLGLANFAGNPGEVDDYLQSLFASIRRCSPLAVAESKKLVDATYRASLAAAMQAEIAASVACLSSPDTQQRVASYLNRR